MMRPLIAIQLLFGVIYSTYQFALPYIMMGTNPGKYADLLVLSNDYFTVPEKEIRKVKPLLTMVGGKIVFQAPNF